MNFPMLSAKRYP